MNIAFFGPSLLSAYWNGAATYYRGIIRALHAQGHFITFYEPDALDRQLHRDIEPPRWANVIVYENREDAALEQVEAARNADLIVKASGVGVFDALLEEAVLDQRHPGNLVAFWDVDAPATLERVHAEPESPLHRLIPRYDVVFTYGGGRPVIEAYESLGARQCVPICNGVDPSTHFPVSHEECFRCDLAFLANRAPEREQRAREFFFGVAEPLSRRNFLLGGSGWDGYPLPPNVRPLGHVGTRHHNAINSSAFAVLNVHCSNAAKYGHSPAARIFEAAGAAACIITDAVEGIEDFFEPDYEILIAQNGEEVADLLELLGARRVREIGNGAFRRALAHHTYANRAILVNAVLEGKTGALSPRPIRQTGQRDRGGNPGFAVGTGDEAGASTNW